MTFADWPESIHQSAAQQRSIAKAKLPETTPASVDSVLRFAVFPGSGGTTYETTLYSCSCPAFRHSSRAPCKHMYRLAMELGLFEGDYQTGTNRNVGSVAQPSLAEVIDMIERLSDDEQLFVLKLLRCSLPHGSTPAVKDPFITVKQEVPGLTACPLFSVESVPFCARLTSAKRKELDQALEALGKSPENKIRRKGELIVWCEENAPEVLSITPPTYTVKLTPLFVKHRSDTRSYLIQKYENADFAFQYGDCVYTCRVPHGVDSCRVGSDGMVRFYRETKFTTFLQKYGHDRCLGGYAVPLSECVLFGHLE